MKNMYDTAPALCCFVPGHPNHDHYKQYLDKSGSVFKVLKGSNGETYSCHLQAFSDTMATGFGGCKPFFAKPKEYKSSLYNLLLII